MPMLPEVSDPDLLVGTETSDDAGVYRLTDDLAIAQSVDVITPLVDDPYDYGRIAAANSLSDIYAMGGKPITALTVIGFSTKKVELETVARIIRGASDTAAEAGCTIVGGHTLQDEEIKMGLAVTGTIHPDRIVRNRDVRPGDRLILTKPLGMGIMTTALKAGKLDDGEIERITAIMARLNRAASEAMVEFGAHAATDVTGFSLLGHAHEMAVGSGVGLRLDASHVPILPEALARTRKGGFISGGTARNREHLEPDVEFGDGIDEDERNVLFDAQTSGGLLIAVDPEVADDLLAALHERGDTDSAVIGEAVETGPGKIVVIKS